MRDPSRLFRTMAVLLALLLNLRPAHVTLAQGLPSYLLPVTLPSGVTPTSIAFAADGTPWFGATGELANIAPDGTVTEHPLPDASAQVGAITTAADGSAWFAENPNRLGHIIADGTVTEYQLQPGENVRTLTVAPDSSIWFIADAPGTRYLERITTD